ncbi:MAG TPA: ribosome biogenesis GTP-binding protein YihA/YsxC [Polyangiaceae bacterium]|nr:ribosome biogenesis GTP-binding protein YihA/YsxC [Polyangiaceae bacterium]
MAQPSSLSPDRIVRAAFTAAATAMSQWPAAMRVEIAFAGRSNVGKSTLLNALTAQHRLARTSSTPGCTRQLVFFDAETADKASVTLVDLPGFGFAKRAKAEREEWGQLVTDYLLERTTLRAVVVLFDARRGLQEDERDLLKLLTDSGKSKRASPAAVLVATKMDLLGAAQRKLRLQELKREAGQVVTAVAASDHDSVAHLWTHIRTVIGLQSPEVAVSV